MKKEYAIFKGEFRFPKTFLSKSKSLALEMFAEYTNDTHFGFKAILLNK